MLSRLSPLRSRICIPLKAAPVLSRHISLSPPVRSEERGEWINPEPYRGKRELFGDWAGDHDPSSLVAFMGLPNTRNRQPLRKKVAEELEQLAKKFGEVAVVTMSPHGKNFAWVEFVKREGATKLVDSQTPETPLMIQEGARPYPYVDAIYSNKAFEKNSLSPKDVLSSETAIYFKIPAVNVEQLMQTCAARFPNANITTNIKTPQGMFGKIILQFPHAGAARDAAESMISDKMLIDEEPFFFSSRYQSIPTTMLQIYNVPPKMTQPELADALQDYGGAQTPVLAPFDYAGSQRSGHWRANMLDLEGAKKVYQTAFDEQFVIRDHIIRVDYSQYSPSSVREGRPREGRNQRMGVGRKKY